MEQIRKSLDRWKRQGIYLVLEDYQKLKIFGPNDLLPKLGSEIKEKKQDLIQHLADRYQEDYEERAAIVSWEGRIPEDFAKAAAHVMVYPRTCLIPPALWEQIQLNASHLVAVDHQVLELVKYGWGPEDFFRCHQSRPLEVDTLQGIAFKTYGMNFTGVDYHNFKCRNIEMKETFFKKSYQSSPEETTIMELQQRPFQSRAMGSSTLLH